MMKKEEFEIDDKGVLVAYHGEGGKVVIPQGVTEIKEHVFYRYKRAITSVILPDSVTVLGEWCFSHCKDLDFVYFPQGLKEIREGAFYQTGLKEVQLPTTVEILGAFAFSDCPSLENVTIPDSVLRMGEAVFEDTPFFETCLAKKTAEGLVIVGNGILIAYLGQGKDTLILPEGITTITYSVFAEANCSSIVLPSTLEHIEDYAFATSLISSIEIPEKVKTIGYRSFSSCPNLETVDFLCDSNLKEIGDSCFEDCKKLSQFMSNGVENELPSSLEHLGELAFAFNSSLRKIVFTSDITQLKGCEFEECSGLEEVILPENLISLEGWCFKDCISLKKINLPPTLKTIGSLTFDGCSSLETLEIPDSVENFGRNCFRNAAFIKHDQEEFIVMGDGILIAYHDLGTIKDNVMMIPEGIKTIAGCVFEESPYCRVELPKTLERIESLAFRNGQLQEIRIPKSVRYIGEAAFAHCHSLKGVFFEANSRLEEIGSRAFTHCYSLYDFSMEKERRKKYGIVRISDTKLEFPRAKLGSGLFQCCTTIRSFELPPHMTEVPDNFFQGCTDLQTVTLPENIEIICSSAFRDCTAMRKLTLPSSLKFIEEQAFQSCTSLSTVVVPDSVEEAHETAFRYCHPFLKIEGWTFPDWEDIDERCDSY